MLLLCALVVGSGNVWADTEVTFTPGTDTGATSVTKSGVSCAMSTMNNSDYYQIYASASGTFSCSSGNITKIEFTCTASGTDKYGPGNASANTGSYSYSGTKGTWTGSAASVTISASKQIRMSSLTVTYSPIYTITAQSNNNTYGTVSLSGSVIKGSPKSGCRYATPAYTVTSGTATVSQEGNDFTVLPTSDCTVRINFEAIPTHTITYEAYPVGAGTFDAVTSLYEGGTTSVRATANSGYKFKNWSVSGAGASLTTTTDNPTTLTMGTADVTLTANFDAVTTHAITYSVNGKETIVNVADGDALDFSAPASGVPMGYTFKGWVVAANKIDIPTDTDPKANYVTSATSTADITYYAVMAVESAVPHTETLTQSEITTNLTNATCAYGTEKDYTDGDIKWTISAYTDAASRPWMQLKKDNTSYIKVTAPTLAKITGLTFTITSTTNEKGGISDITKHTDYSGSIYVDTSAKSTPTGGLGSTSTVSSDDQMSLSVTGNNNVVYMQVGTGARVWGIEVTYNTTSTSHYCTTVSDVPVTVSSASYATFVSDLPLNFKDASSIKAYIAKGKADYSGVTFEPIDKVPANTGVLLYADGGATEYIPVFAGAADVTTGNVFVPGTGATVASVDAENDKLHNYILNNGSKGIGFYQAANQTVSKNRAYIQIDQNASYSVKGFIALPGFGDETAVEAVKAEAVDGVIFNLAGQRVQKLQRGINIVNGKKVVVK